MKSRTNRILATILAAAMIAGQGALGASAESYVSDSAAEPEGYSAIKEAAGDAEMKALGESIRAGAVAAVKTPQPEATTGTVYYISNDGDDANSGTSVDAPWQSIEKVNATTFEPGDMVLFEAGDSWQLEEPLHPLGSGTADAPIVIGAYGEGAKPCFDAKVVADDPNRAWAYGDVTKHSSDGLYLEDQSYIEVRDLEIVNAPDGYDGSDSTVQRNLRDDRRGVHVVATVGSEKKNIQGVYLHDLYVHDVTGDAMSATKWDSSKRSGGIVFETILKDETTGLPIIKDALSDNDLEGYEPAYFSNIIVENNILIDNGYSSIAFKQLKKWGVRPNGDKTTAPQYYHTEEQGWYPHYNITIRNNYLDHDKYELGANTIYLSEYAVISLASGENLIPITITAAGDSAKSKTYTLKINRENADLLAYLTTLDISGITLNPAFTGENPAEDDVIFDGGETNEAMHTLTWVSATDTMSVTVLVNGETVSTNNSGTTEITLQEGANTIVLSTISASADEFKSYTINIQYVSNARERGETEIATPETATEF